MKTVLIYLGIIAALLYLVPVTAFLIVHFLNWRKAFAKIRWWTVIYPVAIFSLTAFPIAPLAWITRKIPVLKNIFWIWMDDARFVKIKDKHVYADDYGDFLGWKEESFKKGVQWHWRNRVWNLESLLAPKKGPRIAVEKVIDKLTIAGRKVDQFWPWIPMARLKYWKEINGKLVEGDQINSGSKISFNKSIFGTGYVWETVNGKLTFRYSFVKPFLGFWLNFVSGQNDKRMVFTIKLKRKKPIL